MDRFQTDQEPIRVLILTGQPTNDAAETTMIHTPISTPVYDRIIALEMEAIEMGTRYRGMATWTVMDQMRIKEIWAELSGLWALRRAEIVAIRLKMTGSKADDADRGNGYGKYRLH